jgi:hypothetical protein
VHIALHIRAIVDLNGGRTHTEIVDHGDPAAWHGTSATSVACTNDPEVLDGLIGALDFQDD